MAGRYKQFLRLLESWPLDSSKKGRDLGHHIRQKVVEAFPSGETSKVNVEECEKVYNSLKRLADNYYGNKFRRRYTSSATGLSREECTGITSTDFMAGLSSSRRRILSFFGK